MKKAVQSAFFIPDFFTPLACQLIACGLFFGLNFMPPFNRLRKTAHRVLLKFKRIQNAIPFDTAFRIVPDGRKRILPNGDFRITRIR